MGLPSNGLIKLTDIATEFGGTPPLRLSNYYAGGLFVPSSVAGIPATGLLRMSQFYGKAKPTIVVGFALIAGGMINNSGNLTSNVSKYLYENQSQINGTSLSQQKNALAAAGDNEFAFLAGGLDAGYVGLSTTERYVFSTDASASSTSLGAARGALGGCGNGTIGLFSGGTPSLFTQTSVVDLFTFSTAVRRSGTSLDVGTQGIASFSNNSVGLTAGGSYGGFMDSTQTANMSRYIYSLNTRVVGVTLSGARTYAAAAGNSDVAYICGGYTTTVITTVDRYIYSNNTRLAGTALTSTRMSHAGAGTSEIGIFAGGRNTTNGTQVASVDKYTYAANTRVSAAMLALAREGPAAISSTPGHF